MTKRGLRDDLVAVLPAWVVARLLAGAGTLFARVAADRIHGGPTLQLTQGFLGWVSWDGSWYHNIAQHGYGAIPAEALRFFPLYPWISKVVGYAFGSHVDPALLLVGNVCALGATVALRRLVLHEKHDEQLARRAVWLFSLFPAAFVLVWAYAEPLFLLAAIAMFLALRQRRWWWAAACGVIAGLTRPVGVALVLPAVVEVFMALRASRSARASRQLPAAVAAVIAPLIGTGAYLAWVAVRFGDWARPFTVQEGLRGETINPASRLVDGVKQLFGTEQLKSGLHTPFAIAFLVLLVVVFWRWPLSYGLFAAAVIVVSLGSANINSLERYGLDAFPLVLGLASITADERADRAAVAASGAGFIALAGLALLGAYVP